MMKPNVPQPENIEPMKMLLESTVLKAQPERKEVANKQDEIDLYYCGKIYNYLTTT